MSYTALYRKFRPAVFDDVKGQEHIVTTLKNEIMTGRIGHAYLFCGTRGTGKTTVAKIFAKAVNCENPKDGSPCGECAMCKAIAAGTSMNVIEIDAASNNGVENIRQIIEEVSYPPTDGKYKVYIMDEAHMLSEGARNALLKTLEEPPSYVIFILATTELQRIPITIMSRCQRYDFRRMSIDTIADRMKELTATEGIDADERALKYIAKAADGSMRDGLSLLDKCAAFGCGEKLTYERALEILGAVDTAVFSELVRYMHTGEIIGIMDLIERVVMQGRELTQFVTDLIMYLRNLMLLKVSDDGGMEDLLNVSSDHLKLLKEETEMFELESIFRYINILGELQNRMKFSNQKRILLEMYMIRLVKPQMDKDLTAITERVRDLEAEVEGLKSGAISVSVSAGSVPMQAAPVAAEPVKKLDAALPEDIERIVRGWEELKGRTGFMLRGLLANARPSLGEGGKLLVCLPDAFLAEALKSDDHKDELSSLFNEYAGKEVRYEIISYNKEVSFDRQYADLLKILHVEKINIED